MGGGNAVGDILVSEHWSEAAGGREGAAATADANDMLNLRLVETTAKHADLTIESLG